MSRIAIKCSAQAIMKADLSFRSSHARSKVIPLCYRNKLCKLVLIVFMIKKCIVHLLLCFKYPEFHQLPIGTKFFACDYSMFLEVLERRYSTITVADSRIHLLLISLIFLLRKDLVSYYSSLASVPNFKLLSSTKKTVFSEFTYSPGRGLLSTEVVINQY